MRKITESCFIIIGLLSLHDPYSVFCSVSVIIQCCLPSFIAMRQCITRPWSSPFPQNSGIRFILKEHWRGNAQEVAWQRKDYCVNWILKMALVQRATRAAILFLHGWVSVVHACQVVYFGHTSCSTRSYYINARQVGPSYRAYIKLRIFSAIVGKHI